MPMLSCIKEEHIDRYPFVKKMDREGDPKGICPPYGLGMTAGEEMGDGLVEISDFPDAGDGGASVLRDDGAVWKDLSAIDVQRLYLGMLTTKPSYFVSPEEARSLIVDVIGIDELSPEALDAFCQGRTMEGCELSSDGDPFAFGSRKSDAEVLAHAESNPRFHEDELQLNNAAWIIASSDDEAFRKQNLPKAIRYAERAVELEERVASGMDPQSKVIHRGNYFHTLAFVYFQNEQYDKALVAIDRAKGWHPPAQEAMREMIESKMPKKPIWQRIWDTIRGE